MKNKLAIRNVGIAVFTELKLGQKPVVLADGSFEFETDMQIDIEQIRYEYANSLEQRIFELMRAYQAQRYKAKQSK
jgi:hypothetical protein